MSGYVILNAEVTDPAGYEEFRRLAERAVAVHDGRYLARGGALEASEGEWLSRLVLLEFPSYEAALRFYRSEEYRTAHELRELCAVSRVAVVEGSTPTTADDFVDHRRRMESLIRRYFDACNAGDADAIAACFVPHAVHYFPPGMYDGPFQGARTIGERWKAAVETFGSCWTVDRVLCDPAAHLAVIEWTHFKTRRGTVLRGDEWYRFDPSSGLIEEIRAYYASPQDPRLSRLELEGFDYGTAGYPLQPPNGGAR
jgi:uncharacterized protein (DUF1330 family)